MLETFGEDVEAGGVGMCGRIFAGKLGGEKTLDLLRPIGYNDPFYMP